MDDSLSSSVELISASPSPQRAAPDITRLLTWHTPRQPPPPAGRRAGADSGSDSDSDVLIGQSRPRPRPRSPVVISDDDDDVVGPVPGSERRRPRQLVISDESEDDDAIPCSQERRRSGAVRPGAGRRRSEDVIEASFDGEEPGHWRDRWGKSATATPAPEPAVAHASTAAAATEAAAAAADSPDSGFPAAGENSNTSAASMIASDESWDGSAETSTRSLQDSGNVEDPRARAQRLYGKYNIKKRTTPTMESPPTGEEHTTRGPDLNKTPPGGQTEHLIPDGPTAATDRKQPTTTASSNLGQPAGAGRVKKPSGEPASRTVIVVPSEKDERSGGTVKSSSDLKSPSVSEGRPEPTGTARQASGTTGRSDSPGGPEPGDGLDLSYLTVHELEQQLRQKEMVARVSNMSALPDGGRRLKATIQQLRAALQRKRSGGDPIPAPAAARERGGSGGGMNEVQRVQEQIRQKKMEYSTSAHRADAARSGQLQRDIFKLETELMKLQMTQNAAGNSAGRNPFALNKTVSHPPVLNRPHGDRPAGPPPADPARDALEAALRRGGPLTAAATEEQRRLEAEARESLRDFGHVRPELVAALLASNPELSRLYGGRTAEALHRQAPNITSEVLERLHRSLETCPPLSAAEPGPECLTVALMAHQQYALSWLRWREAQLPAGGLLADDMGLGKTLTMIAHCLRSAELDKEKEERKDREGEDKENEGESGTKREENEDGKTEREKADFADKKGAKWLSKSKPAKGDSSAQPPSCPATLVVCPASVLLQWEAEVKRRTSGGVTTIVYHGPNRRADHRRLRKADFVLTTYDLVRQEVEKDGLIGANKACPSPLMSYTWRRIILDEAHQIRNRNTKSAKAVCELHAERRWLLSGTPIQNGREDFFSLMRFLRAAPFHEWVVWKRWIDKSPRGDERLSLIVRALVLRRTKDQASPATGKALVALPPREKQTHTVELDKRERQVYDKVFDFCRSSLQEFIKLQEQREYEKELKTNPLARPPPGLVGGANVYLSAAASDGSEGDLAGMGRKGSIKQHHLLVQLLRLRQICCHPGLAKTVMTSSDRESAGVDIEDEASDLESQLMGLSLSEDSQESTPGDDSGQGSESAGRQASLLSKDNPVFSRDWCSAKLRRLMSEIDTIVSSSDDRVVVVSQWTSMLDIVRDHLKSARVASCTISGAVKMAERQQLIEAFNGPARRHGPRVMLLSLLAGGVGLNLVGGNHLFILDPHWNPQLEEQAGDRIYRVGQKRAVYIHRFVCKDTLEERILELQNKKLTIARGVLSGDKQTSSNRLTMSDLKTLFNMQ